MCVYIYIYICPGGPDIGFIIKLARTRLFENSSKYKARHKLDANTGIYIAVGCSLGELNLI